MVNGLKEIGFALSEAFKRDTMGRFAKQPGGIVPLYTPSGAREKAKELALKANHHVADAYAIKADRLSKEAEGAAREGRWKDYDKAMGEIVDVMKSLERDF